MKDMSKHPCFNSKSKHQYGRLHIPVAPSCNIQCKYCNRKYDCINESRPGVSSTTLNAEQSLRYVERIMEKNPNIAVIGIAGPGDAFATPDETLKAMRLIKAKFPDLLLCIATNGLYLEPYAKEIAQIGVSHVTVTVNAVDPKIGAKIYSWVRYQKLMYRGEEGAALLLEKQLSAIRKMKELDIVVKVNTVIIPGINDLHIEEIAKTMAGLKVDILNCIPIYPSPDSEFQDMEQPDEKMIASVRAKAALHLPQMTHCKRCRADAVGLLGETMTNEAVELLRDCSQLSDEASDDRPYVAVGTMEGLLVNAHLGELEYLSIYKEHEDSFVLVEKRKAPPSGSGSKRWEQLGDLLHDCRAILVSGVGESPKKVLLEKGLKVYTVEGLIEDGLDAIYKGNRILQIKPKTKCGESCSGTGLGCG